MLIIPFSELLSTAEAKVVLVVASAKTTEPVG
jgi:hypothetical protein